MVALVYWFYISGPAWNTTTGTSAIYSVLAFLCLTMTASLFNLQRVEDTSANAILMGSTATGFLIFGGSAISNILRGPGMVVHSQPSGIFLNLVAMAFTGIFILLYALRIGTTPSKYLAPLSRYFELIIIILGVSLSLLMTYLIQLPFPTETFILLGYLFGIAAVISYSLATIILLMKRHASTIIDLVRIAIATMFMAISSVILMLILPTPSSLWLFSMGLIGMSFIYSITAITFPYLINIGVRVRRAYIFSVGIAAFMVLPLLVTAILESVIPAVHYVNLPLSITIHIGAVLLAMGSTYVLYSRARGHVAPWHHSVMVLMLFWTLAEIAVVISPILSVYVDSSSLVPYIVGVIVSTFLLALAYRHTLVPTQQILSKWIRPLLFVSVLVGAFFILLGEWTHQLLVPIYGNTTIHTIDSVFMLIFSYLSLFALLNLFFALLAFYGGKLTFDVNIALLPSVWLVIIILRANFVSWTIGWWASESVLYLSVLIYTMHLLHSYLQVSHETADVHERISIQQSLLAPQLLDHLRAISDHVEAIAADQSVEAFLERTSAILNELSEAEAVGRNLGVIMQGRPLELSELIELDIIDLLRSVITIDSFGCTPQIIGDMDECIIFSTSQLADAIRSTLSFLVKRIGPIERVTVQVTPEIVEQHPACNVSLYLELKTDKVQLKQQMLLRYANVKTGEAVELTYALSLIKCLRGEFQLHSSIADSTHLGVGIILVLPAPKNQSLSR